MDSVRRLGRREWGGQVRELTTFAKVETGHRLEWTGILLSACPCIILI